MVYSKSLIWDSFVTNDRAFEFVKFENSVVDVSAYISIVGLRRIKPD